MERMAKSTDAKAKPGSSNKTVFDTFKLTMLNLVEITKDYFVYDMINFINNIDRWIKNQVSENTTKYERGAIVFLDLGSLNFKYEPSYTHPCIVLENRKHTILIVPSSSKKFGKGFPDIIDATKNDGFSNNTGIQIESYRWVHKNRVISVVGRVSSGILDEIDKRILEMVPTYKLKVNQLNAQVKDLENKLQEANTKIAQLQTVE